MAEIKEKNILVRVSARFELSGFDSSIHGIIGQVCAHRTGNEKCFILKVVRQICVFFKGFWGIHEGEQTCALFMEQKERKVAPR